MRLLSIDARVTGRDRGALAAVIESHHPDVVCVHHSPSLLRWRSISASLARQAGLVVVGGGRTGGGNLLLSSLGVDVESTGDVLFGSTPLSGALGPGATMAAMRLLGREFLLVAGRLAGDTAARRAQAEMLESRIAGFVPGDPPVLLSVDGADGLGDAELAARRVAVTGGVFVDARIGVERVEPGLAPQPTLVELTLP